jgi:halocyanin-like protein
MTRFDRDRRRVLMAGGAALTIAIAGCSGGGDDGGNGEENGGDDGNGGNGGGVPSAVEDHLSDANGYDGSVADMTGEDSVTVENGVGEPDYAFEPAAIRVDAGTEVTWEWVDDVQHSVTHNDETFNSEIQGGADTTFSYTFEETGNHLYHCIPHRSLGQKGAVIVE